MTSYRSTALIAAAALLTLAGCGGDGGGGDRKAAASGKATQIRVSNPFHERLLGFEERMRRVGLLRAVRDTGNRCRSVVAATYQQDYEGMAMWVARCQDNRQWAIFIAPSGNVQVRNCGDAQQLRLPACRPFEAAPMAPLQSVGNSVKE